VIRSQLQVPEPWSGELEHALILILSSNPSISTAEIYPRWEWPDEEIADFFGRRFGGGRGRLQGKQKRGKEEFGIPDGAAVCGPEGVGGREGMLALLPHTNHRGARTFAGCLPAHRLAILRRFLRG
jgi:hypothetical protein